MAVITSLGAIQIGDISKRGNEADRFVAALLKMTIHDQLARIASEEARSILSTRSMIAQRVRISGEIERLKRDQEGAAEARKLQMRRREAAMSRRVCSEPWMDAVKAGDPYAPSFKCQCKNCRTLFWERLDPEAARESLISIDCQESADAPDENQIRSMAITMRMIMSEDEVVEKILSIFSHLEMQLIFPQRARVNGGTAYYQRSPM